jgi:hypothetical protein
LVFGQSDCQKDIEMAVVEMMVQKVYPGKWEALAEIDKRFDVVEERHGFPPTKRMSSLSGAHDMNTILIMREWESMAEMESAYTSLMSDPEQQVLVEEVGSIIESTRLELYSTR